MRVENVGYKGGREDEEERCDRVVSATERMKEFRKYWMINWKSSGRRKRKTCECKGEKGGDLEEIGLRKLRGMRVKMLDDKGGGERCERVVSARKRKKEIQKRFD